MNGWTNAWPQEREDRLRKLYADGLSAAQIASALGLETRNAVIGKINRLGLTRNKHNAQPGRIPDTAYSTWTATKIAEFRRLYREGLGDGAIATGLGEPFTRKMVQGKRKNLGLPSHFASPGTRKAARPTPNPPPRTKLKSDGTLASYFAPTQPKLRPEPVDAQPIRVTINQLTAASCRWPLGDPSDLDSFRYCGARVDLPGVVPYCGSHCRRAYARVA